MAKRRYPFTARPHTVRGLSQWQYHKDQLRRQWAFYQHLADRIELLQQEARAILAPGEALADEIMHQVLGCYNWDPLPLGTPQLVKNPEPPQRLTA